MIFLYHVAAITAAYLLDKGFGDPAKAWHPVMMMGKVISFFDIKLNQGRFRKLKGACALWALLLIIGFISCLILYMLFILHPLLFIACEALIIWLMIGGRSMEKAAMSIQEPLQNKNITEARSRTAMIVSRDTSKMDEEGLTRAVLESIGENISDSVTAPLFYALLGGAPLAVCCRFINTADAMTGYMTPEYRQYGWAAARTDDAVNFIPARITALLLAIAGTTLNYSSFGHSLRVIHKHARKHESPNSGFGEAGMAAVLNVTLGGKTPYKHGLVNRPLFGDGKRKLEPLLIVEGILMWRRTIFLFIVICWVIGGVVYVLA
ncbi:adenosylcobinamide-phosphate synthase CbiB [Alteribacillus sp. HJP-4]|uniref:adenosylcobinamide-phosphate synthase CbiB n=1 Tax=Alteribacillus sp. HJP-4 TaxID=2775394 RepID=UPI0035CD25C3